MTAQQVDFPICRADVSESPSSAPFSAVAREQSLQSMLRKEPEDRRCTVPLVLIWAVILLGAFLATMHFSGQGPDHASPSLRVSDTCIWDDQSPHRTAADSSAVIRSLTSTVKLTQKGRYLDHMAPAVGSGRARSKHSRDLKFVLKRNGSYVEESRVFIALPCSDRPKVPRNKILNINLSLAVCAVLLGFVLLGFQVLVSLPLQHLTEALAEVSDDPSLTPSKCSCRETSRMLEVKGVEEMVECLMRGMDNFCRFLPPAVAQNIAAGGESYSHPQVDCREVTIMFCKMLDFTSLRESLPPSDMLSLLTHCFSVMTSIAEGYKGTVAEIRSNGLLVYWNTPTSVDDHVSRACNAALAMHEAQALLNVQFGSTGLAVQPLCIGLHTGSVLSGILGSESRMKFGCLGDPVNLASRLEGLCQHYNVGTVCSAEIRQALTPNCDFLFRRLDTVQVKGRKEPTVVYELMCKHGSGPAAGLAAQAKSYERALDAYQTGHFTEAQELARQTLKEWPNDMATSWLLGRTAGCLDEAGHSRLGAAELEGWTGVVAMDRK